MNLTHGLNLFLVLLIVDLVCGPLLTLVLYDINKVRWKWYVDLFLIALIQLSAFLYGFEKISTSRPIFLAFEGDRYRVVRFDDVSSEMQWPASFNKPLFSSPSLIGVKLLKPADPGFLDSLRESMAGNHTAFRPERWVDYSTQMADVLASLKPVQDIEEKYPDQFLEIREIAKDTGIPVEELGYLPLVQDLTTDWMVIVSKRDALPKGYLHLDAW